MIYSKLEFLKKCEQLLLKNLQLVLDDFTSEAEEKFIIKSNNLSWFEAVFLNIKNNRAIQVIISEGINVDKKQFYGIRFNIQNLDISKDKLYSFSLKDYCVERKLNLDLNWFFVGNIDFIPEFTLFLSNTLLVLKSDEIQKVLFTNYWIEIKPDMSPYK
jgi:hypothetical protein